MEVKLNDESQAELYKSFEQLLMNAVESVQKQTEINQPFIKGKKATAKYLGVSIQTINKMLAEGLKYHVIDSVDSVMFFSKKEIAEFLLEH